MISKRMALAALAIAMCGLLWAADPGQLTFPTAAEACESLFQAVKSNDTEAIVRILGDRKAINPDEEQTKADREMFARKYQEMHRLHRDGASMVLYIGAENWPFPLPLVKVDGSWRFDSAAGLQEVLYRRIGENEETAIAICHAFAVQGNRSDDTSADLVARIASSNGHPVTIHGYNFVAPAPPGAGTLTLVAYPAEYRSSGVMTFVLTPDGKVLEKDLGDGTPTAAPALKSAEQSRKWRNAED